jgi:hypothetical protein
MLGDIVSLYEIIVKYLRQQRQQQRYDNDIRITSVKHTCPVVLMCTKNKKR